MGTMKNAHKILARKSEKNRMRECGLGSTGSEYSPVVESCQYSNEPFSSIHRKKIF
jgi:hypothetical protein